MAKMHPMKGESREHYRLRVFKVRAASLYDRFIRAAREAQQPIGISRYQLKQKLWDALGTHCSGCGEEITPKNMSADHATPLSQGGASSLENLNVLCRPCNEIKGGLNMKQFAELIAILGTWPITARAEIRGAIRMGRKGIRVFKLQGKKSTAPASGEIQSGGK